LADEKTASTELESLSENTFQQPLDIGNFDIDSFLVALARDKFNKDVLKGANTFQATILSVEKNPANFDNSSHNDLMNELGVPSVQYKCWVKGGLYDIFCEPNLKDEAQNKILIKLLPSFHADANAEYPLGEHVYVKFTNTEKLLNPTIEKKISNKNDGQYDANMSLDSKKAFKK
jgi:hypothetical protein